MRILNATFNTAPQITGLFTVCDLYFFHLQARKVSEIRRCMICSSLIHNAGGVISIIAQSVDLWLCLVTLRLSLSAWIDDCSNWLVRPNLGATQNDTSATNLFSLFRLLARRLLGGCWLLWTGSYTLGLDDGGDNV